MVQSTPLRNIGKPRVARIDTDIEGGKRPQVYKAFQDTYGEDRVSKVLTIRTEKAKSAILTACRGLGISPEEASYLASFIKADRGQQRTLEQTYYGDEENDILPDKKFQELMDGKYAEVWKVAKYIAGLCCGVGSHAGGVIFYDEPIVNSTALMRTSNGDVITQYDLHTLEEVSLIKIDLLSIEALDRMRACLDLLGEYGYINPMLPLRQRYEDTIGVYKIERDDPEMWKLIHEHKIESLFQMEQQSGIKGIAAVKPTTLEELATLNSVIRLMAPEKGAEQPVDKFARFKKNINEWYKEMDKWGVSKDKQKLLEPYLLESSGMCESQERFMSLVQLPECGGFGLAWADKLRKSVAKKNPAAFLELEKEFYQRMEEQNLDRNFCKYVWQVCVGASRGYGFNLSHTLGYSIIALQEMNLYSKFPSIFWDTANLIVDSGSMNLEDQFNDSEDGDEEESETKNTSADYGKIATAIGKMMARNVKFSLPNINESKFTFSPNVEENTIYCGFRGITRISNALIEEIIKNRPYASFDDFRSKVKTNVLQMTNLIKSGAFDCFGSREDIMKQFIESISDQKKRITLQNMNMLCEKNLIPEDLAFEKRVFNFNKYINKNFKKDGEITLNKVCLDFYLENFDETKLYDYEINGDASTAKIKEKDWKKIYDVNMDLVRAWMKENHDDILNTLNNTLYMETYNKYAAGSVSKWEMDSLGFYYHDHELKSLRNDVYSVTNYNTIKDSDVSRTITTDDGTEIAIYKISRIAGTVVDKNKDKGQVILLTPDGVVTVKVWKNQFAEMDKQISHVNVDGKKTVVEKSWFQRGTKLIITGMKRDDTFIPKKYKSTTFPLFTKIEEMDDKGFITKYTTERIVLD